MPQSIGNLLSSGLNNVNQAKAKAQQQFQNLSSQVNGAISLGQSIGNAVNNPMGALQSLGGMSSVGGMTGFANNPLGALGGGLPDFRNVIGGVNGIRGGAVQSIDEMLSREDPAWSFQWTVDSIRTPPEVPPLPAGCSKPDDFIESIDLVLPSTSAEAALEMGSNVYYTGFMDANSFNVNFFEYHDWRVLKWLLKWKRCVYNPTTGFYGCKEDYAGEMVIQLLDLSRKYRLQRATCKGIFPTQTNPIVLSGQGERIIISQEFQPDDIDAIG